MDLTSWVTDAINGWLKSLATGLLGPALSAVGQFLFRTPSFDALPEVRSVWEIARNTADALFVLAFLAVGRRDRPPLVAGVLRAPVRAGRAGGPRPDRHRALASHRLAGRSAQRPDRGTGPRDAAVHPVQAALRRVPVRVPPASGRRRR